MNIFEKLTLVQNELKAPKSKYNSFGRYNYRSCEDILEAVKPILLKHKLAMTIKDEIYNSGDRFYVSATVSVYNSESDETVTTTAYAREDSDKKGMDGSQITGSSSSYARKYALNGMFAIDDTTDADGWNKHGKEEKKENVEDKNDKPIKCTLCGAEIKGCTGKDGKEYTALEVANRMGMKCKSCYEKNRKGVTI